MARPDIQEKKNFFEQLTTYIPILSIASLGLGILSQVVYYYPFSLNILEYTEISEIILDTFTNLFLCVIIYLVLLLLGELFVFCRHRYLRITNIGDERLLLRISWKQANISMISVAVVSAIAIWITLNYIESKVPSIYKELRLALVCLYAFSLFSLAFVFYFKLIYETNHLKPLKTDYTSIVFAILTISLYTVIVNIHDAIEKKSLSTYGTYMEMGSKTIMSSQNYYYIGRTKNYIFFYDAKTDFTDVYQNKDVTLLAINNNGFIKTVDKLIRNKETRDSLKKAKQIDSLKHKK